MMMMMMMKNPPGLYVIHMLESDGVKRRALRARRLERPPISYEPNTCRVAICLIALVKFQVEFYIFQFKIIN